MTQITDFILISEAIQKIPLSKNTIVNHIKAGNIKGEKVRNQELNIDEWHIDKQSFEKFVDDYNRKISEKKDEPQAEKEVKEKKPSDTIFTDEMRQNKDIIISMLQEQIKESKDREEKLHRIIEQEKAERAFLEQSTHQERMKLLEINKNQENRIKELEYQSGSQDKFVIDYKKVIEKSQKANIKAFNLDKINVLIIDDDEDFLNVISSYFSADSDIDLYAVSDVYEANKYLLKPVFKILLLDLRLQDENMSGEKYFETIKKLGYANNLKLIIISGEPDERISNAEKLINSVASFKKPVKFEDLKNKIKEIS